MIRHAHRQSGIVLASSSGYRRELLARLGLPFEWLSPDIDESGRVGEAPGELASRLAIRKAQVIAMGRAQSVVIGCDQVAEIDDRTLGKPGTREAAIAQLRAASGRALLFHTALCVMADGHAHSAIDMTTVRFRALDGDEIERYVDADNPLDCAGSFKAEGLGISLFDSIESTDPTALIGLPLIALAKILRKLGFALP